MRDPLLVIAAIIALGLFYVLLPIFLDVFRHYRTTKMVDCPVKDRTTDIHIDAKWAALTSLSGHTKLRVKSCPLLKNTEICRQECLGQLETAR